MRGGVVVTASDRSKMCEFNDTTRAATSAHFTRTYHELVLLEIPFVAW